MNIRKTTASSVAALALLLSASLASAQVSAPLSAAGVKCRNATAKSYQKVMKTALKTISDCHKAKDAGDLALTAVDCNDPVAADTKGKFASAKAKAVDGLAKKCKTGANELTAASTTGKEWYVSCPIPGCLRPDNSAVADPIVTMGDVAACQNCMLTDIVSTLGAATLGSPPQGSLNDADQACHSAIAKNYSKYFQTAIKDDTACQSAADDVADAPADNEVAACQDGPDSKGKVASALAKAEQALTDSCTGVNFAALDSCGADLATLKSCNDTAWADSEDDAYDSTYEFTIDICPRAIRTTILGGCSVGDTGGGTCSVLGNKSGTTLSVGWKGLAHNVDIVDSYTLSGDITCGGSMGACATPICAGGTSPGGACTDNTDCSNGNTCQTACTVDGISYDNPQYQAFTRCRTDSHIPCSNVFGTDTVCSTNADSQATNNECSYFLGPPLAVSAGGTPTCSMNTLAQDVSGTVDPDAGTSFLSVKLNTDVHTGDNLTRPCPICRFDVKAQDDIRDGTCLGGLNDGGACDVQGFDLTYARLDLDPGNPTEGNSLDCPPDPGKAIGSLKINLPLTTGSVSKSAQDPCESPNQSSNCFCGVCGSGLGTDSCDTDQDCDLADDDTINGSDDCAAAAPGAPRLPNNCSDGICVPTGGQTDRGLCSGTPDYEKYCDGALSADGAGIIKCANDASCDVQISDSINPDDWVCEGNDCGNCSIQVVRSCFLDPIALTGTPDTERPILVGTFCLPPSGNGSVNDTTGSPGPAVVQTDSVVEKRY